jgi:hypothetical protein
LFKDEVQAEAVRRFYRISGERLEYKDRAERQGRTGKWELLAKLFWRAAGQEFSEERSIYERGEVTALADVTRLELPCDTSFEQLRVDLLESPPFMRIHAIRLFGPTDHCLWSLPTDDVQENLAYTGLRLAPQDNGCIVAAGLAGEPCSILLNIPQTALGQLVAGGSLRLEISGLEAGEYVLAAESSLREMLAQVRRELAGREEQLRDSAARLSEARRQSAILEQDSSQAREKLREVETSLIWRLTRPLRSLPRF